MADINCSAPDCTTSWPATTAAEVLIRLIDLHARTAHPAPALTAPPATNAAKAEKIQRPTISAAGTSEEWAYFKQRWSDYKTATHLPASDIIYQLLECCDEGLRKDLTRSFASLSTHNEETVLKNIKSLAVRQENIMVARMQLHHMRQDRDEPVRAFCARLKGQAGVCHFMATCTCELKVDYGDIMIRDALIIGLDDDDIRLDVLAHIKPDKTELTLEETLALIDAKETGKRSVSRLLGSTTSAAATQSSYRKQRKQNTRPRPPPQTQSQRRPTCDYCGETGHSSTRQERISKCPAYNEKCDGCGGPHHRLCVCRKTRYQHTQPAHSTSALTSVHHDDATAVFQSLCTINDDQCSQTNEHCADNNTCGTGTCDVNDTPNFEHCVHNDTHDVNHEHEQLYDSERCVREDARGMHDAYDVSDACLPMPDTERMLNPTSTSSCPIVLNHHVYNEFCNMWEHRGSDPQPMVDIYVHIDPCDAKDLNVPSPVPACSDVVIIPAMADTGCQSCLAGTSLLPKLGLTTTDLLPVSMKMTAANDNAIDIAGALVLRLSGETPQGTSLSTRQLVYFSNSTKRFFLCKQACVALKIIPKSFPQIGEAHPVSTHAETDLVAHKLQGGIPLSTLPPTPPPHRAPCAVQPAATGEEPPRVTDPAARTRECDCPCRQKPPPKPTSLPYPATAENRDNIEKWLLDYYKSSTFNVCEHQPLPMMSGPPLRLMIDPNGTPIAHHNPIPVPIHWQEAVKAGLDTDVELGVLEPVPVGTPVTWCSRMVIAAKKSGKPRRTVDLQPLNRYAVRETHHTQSPFHQARSIPSHKYKTVMDAWNGYHSIPLHEDDRHLTTFITPWGRYRYCVAPQGYIASGDGYTRRYDEITSDVPRKTKCIDDTLLWDDSIHESFLHTIDYLDMCGNHGITLNPQKFAFAKTTVEFAGFEVTPTTVRPCSQFIDAILQFPVPKNITDVRSWFGLVNQVSYAFATADRMFPFRNLLKPDTQFVWTKKLDDIFNESKSIIAQEIRRGVEIYDRTKRTCLVSDWSKEGVGFWLFQKHCPCKSS